MAEAEWLRCVEPHAMLSEIAPRLSDRQLWLFAVACYRRVWHLLPDATSRHAVVVAERYADGQATDQELFEAAQAEFNLSLANAAYHCAARAALRSEQFSSRVQRSREQAIQCSLLRDITGNPFAPVEFAPHWRTRDVLAVAQRIYQQHDFAALPILADALTDAGCEDAAILNHCEQPHHARGCWLLDRIQGMK